MRSVRFGVKLTLQRWHVRIGIGTARFCQISARCSTLVPRAIHPHHTRGSAACLVRLSALRSASPWSDSAMGRRHIGTGRGRRKNLPRSSCSSDRRGHRPWPRSPAHASRTWRRAGARPAVGCGHPEGRASACLGRGRGRLPPPRFSGLLAFLGGAPLPYRAPATLSMERAVLIHSFQNRRMVGLRCSGVAPVPGSALRLGGYRRGSRGLHRPADALPVAAQARPRVNVGTHGDRQIESGRPDREPPAFACRILHWLQPVKGGS